jgi:cytochrome c oxidase assembly protein Cox11
MKNRSFEVALVTILAVGIALATYAEYPTYKVTCPQIWAHGHPEIGNPNDVDICRPHYGVRNG